MMKECKKLSYCDRLRYLKLPTLKYRRLRGDMIEVFKILNGYYDKSVVPNLTRNLDTRTRGNCLRLSHSYSCTNLKKFSFCTRVVAVWNSLPDHVVVSLSVNSFKNNLDKFWSNEDIYLIIKQL